MRRRWGCCVSGSPARRSRPRRGTLSIFLTDLGDAQRDVGDLEGAVESYREAVGIRKPMVESDPAALNYRRRLHILNRNLAEVFGWRRIGAATDRWRTSCGPT